MDDGWCRCWHLGNGPRYLGANTPRVVLTRLLEHLEAPEQELMGELAGHSVRWVLALEEEHTTLYAARKDRERLLFIQDAAADLIGQLTISEADWERWRRALEDALSRLHL